MVDVLQRHPLAISMGVVSWLAWSGMGTEPEAKGLSLDELPRVEAEYVRVRAVDETPVTVRDPFPALASPEDFQPELQPDVIEDDVEEEPEVVLVPKIVTERRPRFLLELDSIMALGGSGTQALINGRTISLGAEIPACDPESPPVFVELSGLTVTIEHRDTLHQLHLDDTPSLLLGGEIFRHVVLPDGYEGDVDEAALLGQFGDGAEWDEPEAPADDVQAESGADA